MGELLVRLGHRLIVSRRHQCIRRCVVFLVSNALLIGGVVFTLELLVICMGLDDIFLPLTRDTLSFLSRIFF
jgi:hypothetical protein